MEENIKQETVENTEPKKKGTKYLIGLLVAVLLVGSGYYLSRSENPNAVNETKIPMQIADFQDLPVGLIYEYSEEEKEAFLEEAKKGNTSKACQNLGPNDTLNEDGSLRNSECFIGQYTSYNPGREAIEADSLNKFRFDSENIDIDAFANMALHYENFYATGGKRSNNFREWTDAIEFNLYGPLQEQASEGAYKLRKLVKNGFINTNTNSATTLAYNLMGLGPLIMTPYQFLEESAEMQYPKTYVSGLTGSISKYNIADSIDSKNTSYYFPTRVWKAADNNVFVDIQIENGGMLSSYDVEKINNNIIYSNMSGVKEDSLYLFDQEKVFLVDARYFDSDISQGMLPEFGLKLANRAPWEPFGDMTAHSSYDVVLNDDANNLLRDYFKEVKRLHNEDLPINTLEIMKEISEQHNIPFEDAINIWAVHTLSSVLMGRASMDLYIKSYD